MLRDLRIVLKYRAGATASLRTPVTASYINVDSIPVFCVVYRCTPLYFIRISTCVSEDTYKNYKRLFETIKRKSKANYFNDQLRKYQNNVKKTWDVIKEVIGSTKSTSHTLPKRLIINNVEVLEKKKIAEHFNRYFVNIGQNLASKIPTSQKNFQDFLTGNYPSFAESPLTDDEIKIAFTSLKSKKSSGFDDVSPNVVTFAFDALFRPIKHVFALSIKSGIFPDKL